ncbi:MAG: hypothetical protein ABI646_01765 [Acidobacteriota bacterium]
MRKLSSTAIWLAIFGILVAVQAYSAFGQTSEITGTWKDGSVGSIQYQNQVTGATRSGRSHIFTYKFFANGSYEFVGYMEVTMYNCTTTLFNDIKGRYTVDGSTIHLNPTRDFWKNTNSCAAIGNKETTKAPLKKSLQFERKEDDYGRQLLCIQDGEANTCYGKEK